MTTKNKAAFALWVLFAINLMNFFDRQILGAVGETVRNEWHLSDTALGLLGTIFTLVYAAVGDGPIDAACKASACRSAG